MLQQTQVNTVIPYYKRWMEKFPTLRKLAEARLLQVLRYWAGLGYYSRARNMHRAAKLIVKERGGKFPNSTKKLMQLPGIGRYTAGAIASIAFGKPEPILDGNVMRVLSRVFALRDPIDINAGKEKLWEISRDLVTGGRSFDPGDLNQSLMELGALVCLPDNPKCSICCLKKICQAKRLSKESEFPIKSKNKKIERLRTVAAIIWKNGRVLLKRQLQKERWGGLWIFPQWIYANGENETEFLKDKLRRELGIRVNDLKPKTELIHGYTKYRVRLRVFDGKVLGRRDTVTAPKEGGETPPLQVWIKPKNFSRLPLPSPHQKIARLIQSHA